MHIQSDKHTRDWEDWERPYIVRAETIRTGTWFLTVSGQALRRIRWYLSDPGTGILVCRDQYNLEDSIIAKAMVLPLVFEDHLPDCTTAQYGDAYKHKRIIQGVAMFPMCSGIASAYRDAAKKSWIDNLPPGCEPEDFDDEDAKGAAR